MSVAVSRALLTVPAYALLSPCVSLALLVGCGDSGGESTGEGTTAATESGATTTMGASASTMAATGGASETGTAGSTGAEPIDYEQPGPHPVGNTRFTLEDGASGRSLLVEVWYPADAGAAADAAAGHPIEEFVPAGADRDRFVDLLASAPDPGTRRQTSSAFGGAPLAGEAWPVIAFSHCHGCTRFSKFTIAERLASHGFAVVAPDHQGNTLFNALDDDNAPLSGEFLATRAGDISAVLDAVLDAESAAVEAAVRGRFDGARVGMMGHSYGATTSGLVAETDDRVRAAVAIAAPIENPLLPGPMLANIHKPLLFVLAVEDNSIQEIGNNILRNNFNIANPPTWLISVNDAGHWGFSDICGITEDYAPGCGEGTRQTDGTEFTYLDVDIGRGLVAAYATAFFDAHLNDAAEGAEYLMTAQPEGIVELDARL